MPDRLVVFVVGLVGWLFFATLASPHQDAPALPPDPAPQVSQAEFLWACVNGGGTYTIHHNKTRITFLECVGGDKNGWLFQVDEPFVPANEVRTQND
jgi:hypothetical protein